MKELAIRENARKRREDKKQRVHDAKVVSELVANEREQRYEEAVRQKQKTEILQNAYDTQVREKQIMQGFEAEQRQKEATGTSFIDGSFNKFGNLNYDYRNDIAANEARKTKKSNKFRNVDHQIVDNLDNYDREMVHNERERKREQMEMLNKEYNTDLARLEREKNDEADARKHLRPVVYGRCESPTKCKGSERKRAH